MLMMMKISCTNSIWGTGYNTRVLADSLSTLLHPGANMKLFELLSSRENISFFRPTIEITLESGVFRGANIRWPLVLTQ